MLLTVDYQQAYAEQTHMRVKRHRHHATKATTRPTEQRAPGTVNSWNDMGGGMTKLNPFRISRRQPNRDATRARVTATVVGSAAIFLGATSMMALVGSTSEATGRFSNANPPPAVRILATDAEDPSGKACEEQTWPYIESRCLKPADPRETARSTPKHGLGSQPVALTPTPIANAPASEIMPAAESTRTNSAVFDGNAEATSLDTPDLTRTVLVPIPVPAPVLSAQDQSAPHAPLETNASQKSSEVEPRLSKRELRLMKRQERKRLQRERREETRRMREERVRARAFEREARSEDNFRAIR